MPYVIIAIVVVAIILYFIITRNKLVVAKNKVKQEWAGIDVQLKKRADLIPNLVEIVKGYMKHESETLENIVEARNKIHDASSIHAEIEADNEIVEALHKIFALSESYPDLKSSNNFLSLQKDLSTVENQISSSRQMFNKVVLEYNNYISMFPSNIIASLCGYKKEEFFEIKNDIEREVPKIEF